MNPFTPITTEDSANRTTAEYNANGVQIHVDPGGDRSKRVTIEFSAAAIADVLASVVTQRDDFTLEERRTLELWVARLAKQRMIGT